MDNNGTDVRNEIATFGGGCFWCLEAIFSELRGVTYVQSGYAGGHVADPTYEQVCTGSTGHAEVVQITFNPDIITFRDLLKVFFTIHDPTTPNRQGNDVGGQYRSVVYCHSDEQFGVTKDVVDELTAEQVWSAPIVTQVEPFKNFYPAEDYHKDYFSRNPRQSYCQAVIAPKVAKFRTKFLNKLKKD
jgi:peptide-methionine (S)-S-oxide reductase